MKSAPDSLDTGTSTAAVYTTPALLSGAGTEYEQCTMCVNDMSSFMQDRVRRKFKTTVFARNPPAIL